MTPYNAFWDGLDPVPVFDPEVARTLYETSPLSLRSRCAPFTMPGVPRTWIKRDDELSFVASGSKLRKYAALVPCLVADGTTDVVLLGGRNANNVLAATQLLTEAGITCHLLLRAPVDPRTPDTVFDLVGQLVPPNRITHVPRSEWDGHDAIAGQLSAELGASGRKVAVVPEGGSRLESMPGAMTLGLDVRRNETELGREFSDFFIEAGTGLSAIGLALGLAAAPRPPTTLHVLCTAAPGPRFLDLYRRWTSGARGRVPRVVVYEAASPARTARMTATSRATGVLFDPHYSGRLLEVAGQALHAGTVGDSSMFVHTGGMGLLSYLEQRRGTEGTGR